MPSVPIIDKYLIGATSFLHQPSNYYDIFRACRCVNIIHVLDAALGTLLQKGVAGLGSGWSGWPEKLSMTRWMRWYLSF